MGCFWLMYIIFELRKYRGIIVEAPNINKKFEGKLTCASKKATWGICQLFIGAIESLKIGTLMGFFDPK